MDFRIEASRNRLAELCRRHRVRSLDVFGSAADDRFDPESSDFDFVVEFEDLEPRAFAASYFGLLEDLAALLGRPIDLVVDAAIANPFFRAAIEPSRTTIHGR